MSIRAALRAWRPGGGARSLGAALGAAALCSCATLEPHLQAPTLSLASVQLQGGNVAAEQLQLQLQVDNPNDREISVSHLEVHLDLAGQPFANGVSDAPFTLPARGSTSVVLDVTADLTHALGIAADAMLRRRVDYHLYGTVHLRNTLLVHVIDFKHDGEVRLR